MVPFQQEPELIPKRDLSVMFFLGRNVVAHRLDLRKSDRENRMDQNLCQRLGQGKDCMKGQADSTHSGLKRSVNR
jgi:hypothetical protein